MRTTSLFRIGLSTALSFLCPAALASFTDVSPTHPYRDAIRFVQEQGIVEGYTDGTFRPDAGINRAEFTKILVAARFTPSEIAGCLADTQVPFSDTPPDDWFAPYVCTAFRGNIVSGYPDMSFKPSNGISYAEAAKMLKETFGVPWEAPITACSDDYRAWYGQTGDPNDARNPYWWQKFVCALRANNLLPPTYSKPEQPLTRGEMAEMIYRMHPDRVTSSRGDPSAEEYKLFVDSVPVFPGADRVSFEKNDSRFLNFGGPYTRGDYFTTGGTGAVVAFYDRQLIKNGWEMVRMNCFDTYGGCGKSYKTPYEGKRLHLVVGNRAQYEMNVGAAPQSREGTYFRLFYTY